MTRSDDFSLAALYAALDAQRRARGLTWSAATREINQRFERSAAAPLAVSTVTGTRTRAVAEGDGVLQMLLWLERTPESFLPGHPDDGGTRLPAVASDRILRFDTPAIHAALDARRAERARTWAQVAKDLGLGVTSLTRLANGGRTAFPQVMRMIGWLDQPAARFTRVFVR